MPTEISPRRIALNSTQLGLLGEFHLIEGRVDELPGIVKFLEEPARNDGHTQATSQKLACSNESLRVFGEQSSLEAILFKRLHDRFKASLAANKRQSNQTPAETDGAEGERGALSNKTAINTTAHAFARNREAVVLALRYRTKIERSRDNALHELQRFQAARQGRVVAAPGPYAPVGPSHLVRM